jgi:NTE family protein
MPKAPTKAPAKAPAKSPTPRRKAPALVPRRKTVAVALGGGGARGLAHIPVLEAIEEAGFEIVAIAGTSMGALVGASLASGLSAKDLRTHVMGVFRDRGIVFSKVMAARMGRWADFFSFDFVSPITLDAQKLFAEFLPSAVKPTFEDLPIPFAAVATDYYARQEIVFTKGPLLPAVAASAAVPGLFRPVVVEGRVLVDGAAVDPNPLTALPARADVTLVVDVIGAPPGKAPHVPSGVESLFGTVQIMQAVIAERRAAANPPDITIRPNVTSFGVFDFLAVSSILRAAEPAKQLAKTKLEALRL